MAIDMILFWLIVLFGILLILTTLILLWYCGLFIEIEIKTGKPTFKDLEVAYKYTRGPHNESGALFTEVTSIAPCLRHIGIYYDSLSQANDNKMRFAIGIILNDEERQATEEMKKEILSKGFKVTTFPAVENVVHSSFPYQSSISVVIAVNRVIPKFMDYIKEHKLQAHPLIQIYDGLEIYYAAPLSNQNDFYVLEALADSEDDVISEQRTEEGEELSLREIDELPDTLSSIDSLIEGGSKVEELPSNEELLDSLEDKLEKGASNGSDTSTESFEELQMDS